MTILHANEGPPLTTEQALLDLIGATWGKEIETVVLPVARLGEDFFNLKTGIAGNVAQKFANYRLRLVILGDVTEHMKRSDAFRDFVIETNRGNQLWFLADQHALEEKLSSARPC